MRDSDPPDAGDEHGLTRRTVLRRLGGFAAFAAMQRLLPAYARAESAGFAPSAARPQRVYELAIVERRVSFGGHSAMAMTINGTVPGPVIRLREGDDVTLKVTNRLAETSSIHWHGLLVPPDMDGVPGVSFAGIRPGETFVYRFRVRQSGTYWCHSHSGGQELLGVYAPMILEPIEREPFEYERDHVLVLSDWAFDHPMKLIRKLKQQAGYFNRNKLTIGDLFGDASRMGLGGVITDRWMWSRMRMDPTDILDVTGDAGLYLLNGRAPSMGWTALYSPGERVRLRFINAGASTFFDVRVPGLRMTVVQADGQNVQPVIVDELRLGPAETYDVIVTPDGQRAYAIFAESIDRSGHALGTLAPRGGMRVELPAPRPRPRRSMADMGMDMAGHGGMSDHGGMAAMPAKPGMTPAGAAGGHESMPSGNGQEGAAAQHPASHGGASEAARDGKPDDTRSPIPGSSPVRHGGDKHGPGNASVPEMTRSRLHEPGAGLEDAGHRVLVYTDLRSVRRWEDQRPPAREIELHVTGNMDRFMWSFDGKKYSEAKTPIAFRYGERLRFTFVNDTMMEHPLHLHGMWMYLENGTGGYLPRKHTVIVKPAERLSVAITADAPPGRWAFHCHLLLHMEMGMFRVVEVSPAPGASP